VSVTVRTATAADLPELRRVYRDASLSNSGDRAALLAQPEFLVFAGDGIAAGRTRVACTADGRLVGFASTIASTAGEADRELELEDLFVDPPWMRRGVATLLVRDAVARAQRAGFGRITVTGNPHALAFYLAVGFVEVGRQDTALGEAAPRLHLALD
jgi:GNAT superfamily N-acetyltransferase